MERSSLDARTEEVLRELVELHPRIFKEEQVRCGMWYGPGWHQIMVDLLAKVETLLTEAQLARFRIDQVKEKFGTLRVYYRVGGVAAARMDVIHDGRHSSFVSSTRSRRFPSKEVAEAIEAAEQRSAVTCYFCGALGILREAGWMRVTCVNCEATWYSGKE